MLTFATVENEYKKNPRITKDIIQELLQWTREQPQLPEVPEMMLICFYHSCYYNLERTKNCILTYYKIRMGYPEFFADRDITIENLKSQAEVVQYGIIAEKDLHGNQIFFHRLSQFEPPKYVFHDSCKLFTMAIDSCIYLQGTMQGAICLFDMSGVRLAHVLRLSLSTLKIFFSYVQEGMPIRLKAVHVVNTLPIIDTILFIIKPFIKKELLQLVHFHSGDYEDIKKIIPNKCLPSDYGGSQPSGEKLNDEYKQLMFDLKDHFKEKDKHLEEHPMSSYNKPREERGFFSSFFY